MKTKTISFEASLTLLYAISLLSLKLHAAEPSVCYKLEVKESPAAELELEPRVEIWCYQKLMNPAGSIYIYNADSNQVKPELAMVIDKDGTMTHTSLLAGKLTVHRVHTQDFNPFSIPLEEPKHLQPLPSDFNTAFALPAENVLNFLLTQNSTSIETFNLRPGSFRANASILPWRGFWWPYKGQPLLGPMVKYDRYVSSRSGSNPNAAAWERSHHFYKGTWWEGHCNGWAASSILRSEPRGSRSSSGVTFTVSDIKGLLSEVDSCVSASFFGNRYRGSGGDIRDIYPAAFHKTITYYIGSLGKPVVMDYYNNAVVDNHVVSGYTMTINQTGSSTFNVTTSLRMHKYDTSRINTPGVAPSYTRTYRYTLRTDGRGNVVGGSWLTTNPDFIWIPLSPGNCSGKNRGVSDRWINTLLY